MDIPFHILEQSTNGFSDEEKLLGCGGYGKVYKGLDQNGTDIAVKVLHPMLGNDRTPIQNEFSILMKLKHSNIVRLVGYCYEDVRKHVMHQGQLIFSTHMHRILCFEYVHGGSLCNYLSEESCGCKWSTRYNIIKGICDGLNFMHGLDKPIFHLDLKPSNILLDKNMKAKIADFGLSKLFHGTHTHTTSIVIGTWKYMPPEFITKHHISEKNDVFSLGIIIIEIMTGPAGYEKFGEMDVTQFTELVNMNWRNRIHATSSIYPIEEVAQVETCIKIAVECVDSERKNRPTVKEIVHRLSETEITNPRDRRNGAPSLIGQVCSEASITKFGLWGGKGGASHDLEVLPQRLISVVVRCGKVIDSLAFTYCDFNGQQRTGGPWGDRAAHEGDGSIHTILLGPSEFLLEVNGTIGPSPYFGDAVMVSSIMFVTNTDSYGPFGEGGGTKFQSPVRENGSIVGFYANAGGHIDAVGFYYKLEREMVKQEAQVARVGPWGGNTGWSRDIQVVPRFLNSIIIRSGEVVVSLAFSYSDDHGKQHHAGIWGSYGARLGGTFDTIELGPSEFLTGISGTVGLCSNFQCNVVTSLNFITNARKYGPFGGGKGIPFQSPVVKNGSSIVGFFAHATGYVDAVGVYLKVEAPRDQSLKEEAVVTKIGPWGGHSWGSHDVEVLPRRLISVVVHSGNIVNSLEYRYSDCDGQEHTAGPWGEGSLHDGSFHTIRLAPLEVLKQVSGTIGPKHGMSDVITSLSFVTSAGTTYGPFGDGEGSPFRSPLQPGRSILGFFAHIDRFVVGIGVYVGKSSS